MLQPSQVTNSLLFLGFSILLIAIFVPTFLWAMRKTISNLQELPEFTDFDVAIIRRQMMAVLVGMPFVVLFFALARLVWDQPTPSTVFIALIMGFAPLAYIAVSSIRNRVSIIRGRERLPVKGAKAVWSGVLNLMFIILTFTGFAIYFALYFDSLK